MVCSLISAAKKREKIVSNIPIFEKKCQYQNTHIGCKKKKIGHMTLVVSDTLF